MEPFKFLACCLAMLQGLSLAQPITPRQTETAKALVLSAAPEPKGVVYRLDGKVLSVDLLRGFGQAIEKFGAERPVIILVDDRLPISTIGEAAGTAGKAGFTSIQILVADHSSDMVNEVKFAGWVPAPK